MHAVHMLVSDHSAGILIPLKRFEGQNDQEIMRFIDEPRGLRWIIP
jgi:hypothetical protein